ncbi:MAG TPA: NAD(P)-dependent oxidoreductase [Caulobacteraceae bacterium]|jgi:precorrin-2 dehydrogenase/sirohydrochlorin ferrochelatase
MQTFPAFFPLRGRRVVIAGDGDAADAKARLFDGSPAEVVRLRGEAAFEPSAYAGAALAFVASADEAFVQEAAAAARSAHTPLNVVDHPALCDFQTPAIVDRGQVVAAVGTTGAAPVMATLLRAELEARISPAAGDLARLLAERREAIRAAYPDLAARRALFRRVLSGPAAHAAEAGDLDGAARAIETALADRGASPGRVVVVLAPAEPDRLSLRAARALNVADAVIAGEAAKALVQAHARRDAERLARINPEDLARRTAAGLSTVIVTGAADQALLSELTARGVEVELLSPAP